MRLLLSLSLLLFALSGAHACPRCRPQVQAGIYNASWGANAGTLLLPLIVIGVIAALAHYAEPIAARWKAGRS